MEIVTQDDIDLVTACLDKDDTADVFAERNDELGCARAPYDVFTAPAAEDDGEKKPGDDATTANTSESAKPAEETETVAPKKKRYTPDDAVIAQRWIDANKDTVYGLNDYRRYDNGVWRTIDEAVIHKSIVKICEDAQCEGYRVTSSRIASVAHLMRLKTGVEAERWDANPDYLPCRNGVLEISTNKLQPHNPELFATTQLDYDYDPAADCPAFRQALLRISDAADFLQEFAGYALTIDMRHEIAVWLQGVPGSGKSSVLEGIQTMLGQRAGLLGLEDVERSRFALSQLPGKTLVVSSEQPGGLISASHILNALVSGEPLKIERKYYDPVTVIPKAKVLWSMNNLPQINDANNGLMRRVKVIAFPPLPPSQIDIGLKDKIKTEGAGILNWALEGLARLRARGKFLIPQSVMEATQEFKTANDIASLFLSDVCAVIDRADPDCRTPSQFLHNEYREWCRQNGHYALSSVRMSEEWKRLGFKKVRTERGVLWQGVLVKSYRPTVTALPEDQLINEGPDGQNTEG